MPTDPLDILWDQIQIAYAAIIRAQQIMYVRDAEDKTVEKVERKDGNVIGEKWEVQQAWDKQANFLSAQARAQHEPELARLLRRKRKRREQGDGDHKHPFHNFPSIFCCTFPKKPPAESGPTARR